MVDYDKVAELVIREIRTEKFGQITFEWPANFAAETE